jgi:predicted DNA-binding transcriptional regulator AlpA
MSELNPFEPFFAEIRKIVAEEVARAVKGSKDDRLLDIDELCAILNVQKAWIYHNARRLPFSRKIGGNLRFSSNDLQRWIAAQKFQDTTPKKLVKGG